MATRGTKKPVAAAQNTAPTQAQTAPEEGGDLRPPVPAVALCAEQNNNEAGGDLRPPRHYRCLAACYHGRRLWQVGEETITTDDMPHHFEEVKR